MPARGLGQRVEVEARLALLAAGQVRGGQLTRQPPIAFRTAGQHQQMRTWRIRLLGAGFRAQRQFGAEHGTHVEFHGRFGEPHRPVQAVVVGQRQRAQIQPGRLFDHLLGCAGTVEEAVRRMRMQFGVRDGRTSAPGLARRRVPPTFVRHRAVFRRASWGGRARVARLAVEQPLHFRPTPRFIAESHALSLSKVCSIWRLGVKDVVKELFNF